MSTSEVPLTAPRAICLPGPVTWGPTGRRRGDGAPCGLPPPPSEVVATGVWCHCSSLLTLAEELHCHRTDADLRERTGGHADQVLALS